MQNIVLPALYFEHMSPCRVEVVSDKFKGQTMVQCHRLVYGLLDEELKNGVHALSLRTKTQ